MKRLIVPAFIAVIGFGAFAFAQSNPGLIKGQVPSAADWNSYFAAKQDVLGYVPVNKAGDTMTGKLKTCTLGSSNPPGLTSACFNLPPGGVPVSPVDGDLWMTNGGLYAQIGGTTVLVNSTSALAAIAYSGSASDIVAGTMPPGHLNPPSVADLGGVHSLGSTLHFFVTGVRTDGTWMTAQPAANDISGLAASATIDTTNATNIVTGTLPNSVIPVPTLSSLGGVKALAALSHNFLTGIGTDGVPIRTQPVASDVAGLAASATTDTTNAANITSGTLPAGRLPTPGATTLGGVKSLASTSHNFITGLGTDGALTRAQPSASDVSGLAASATIDTTNAGNISSGTLPAARLPAPTATTLGGVESLASTAHNFLTGIGTDGVPTRAQPAAGDITGLAASATTDTTNASNITSGTLPNARVPAPTSVALGGVKAATAATHSFVTGIDTTGALVTAQPAASDITGLAASATVDTTNAANITSGVFGYGHCPAATTTDLGCVYRQGVVAGVFLTGLNPDGSFSGNTISCSTLTDEAPSCSTDATNASNITSGTLPAARLPTPTATTLGGVKSLTATTHQFVTSLNLSGSLLTAQPSCADISDAKTGCNGNATVGLCQSGAAQSAGNDTTEDILAACSIAAGLMGTNGCVRVETTWSFTANANTKTMRVKYAAQEFLDTTPSGITRNIANFTTVFCNRASTGSQVGWQDLAGDSGFQTGTIPTGAVDSTVQHNVTITAQKGVAGDTLTLERYAIYFQPSP